MGSREAAQGMSRAHGPVVVKLQPGKGCPSTMSIRTIWILIPTIAIIEAKRSRTIYNWLQYFSPEALAGEFEGCGFAVEGYYSDVAGAPFAPQSKEFAVIARKR